MWNGEIEPSDAQNCFPLYAERIRLTVLCAGKEAGEPDVMEKNGIVGGEYREQPHH